MRVLILGSGGREHALGWGIVQGRPASKLYFCPGNGGTGELGTNLGGKAEDAQHVADLVRAHAIDLVLIGPEAPLVAGVGDQLRESGVPVFGPSARAAQIEGSKVFAKLLMRENGVPTPSFDTFCVATEARAAASRGPFPKVIKADGLAAGKGVIIARTRVEATTAITEIMEDRRFGGAGEQLLIESYLQGEEVSAFAVARDTEFRLLPLAQDHKRIGDGDTGPNTGGMGAYAPYPRTTPELLRSIATEVFEPTLSALARGGRPFQGLLYAGLMIHHGKVQVLEFNCRFGDPETQAVVPLLGEGFVEALLAVATGEGPLPEILPAHAATQRGAAATVVLASRGYPGEYRTGLPIMGIDKARELPETFVFHAGTRREDRRLLTAGGRVLSVTGRGRDLREALRRAYEGCSVIEFEGKTFRKDIGRRGLS